MDTHKPTTAQVVSATIQNVVALAVVAGAWQANRIDSTVALVAVAAIVGVDLFGRVKGRSDATMAVAFGATGIASAAHHAAHAVARAWTAT